MSNQRYTEREVRFIRDHYSFMTDADISLKMKRSSYAVKRFRHTIGLYKSEQEFARTNVFCKIASLKSEEKALLQYLLLNKLTEITTTRLLEVQSQIPVINKVRAVRKDRTPLRIVAKIYSMSTSGMSHKEISDETGFARSSITIWVNRIKGVKYGEIITLPSKV